MTTPGGVPNLPQGALTLETLAFKTQDTSTAAMKARAAERFPSIFNNSTGLNPASDITPFGILTNLWSGFNSFVANADPADIDGPEDLPGLLIDFIESLPVVGQLLGLLEAILGTYDGDDKTLLAIQDLFAPIRLLLSGDLSGFVKGELEDALGFLSFLEGLFNRQDSEIASMKAQLDALHRSKQDITTPDAGWDHCVDASGFDTPLVGSFTPTGYGTLTSASTVFGHYGVSPTLERNRVGAYFKTKRVGWSLLYFCSDDDATNWCGLLLNLVGNGHDTMSVVTGSGPATSVSDLVTRGDPYELRLPSSGFYECAYEPFSEDSPTSNMFHFFLGGQEIVPLRWNDAGNAILHTAGNLRWGVGLNLGDDAHTRGYDVTDVSYGSWQTGAPQ